MHSHKNKDPVIMHCVDDLQHNGVSLIATTNVLATLNGNNGLLPMNERDLEKKVPQV